MNPAGDENVTAQGTVRKVIYPEVDWDVSKPYISCYDEKTAM